jgi:hypothetical protein
MRAGGCWAWCVPTMYSSFWAPFAVSTPALLLLLHTHTLLPSPAFPSSSLDECLSTLSHPHIIVSCVVHSRLCHNQAVVQGSLEPILSHHTVAATISHCCTNELSRANYRFASAQLSSNCHYALKILNSNHCTHTIAVNISHLNYCFVLISQSNYRTQAIYIYLYINK